MWSTCQGLTSFHLHPKIRALPSILVRPEEREYRFASWRQRSGWQIENVNPQLGVASVCVVRGPPVVNAPVNHCRGEHDDPQGLVPRDAAGFVVEAPAKDLAHVFLFYVSLHCLWGLVENFAVAD